jgi:hypothetical protein
MGNNSSCFTVPHVTLACDYVKCIKLADGKIQCEFFVVVIVAVIVVVVMLFPGSREKKGI